jgi:peptide-methionine (R)-S-oxide reductase
MLSRRTIGKATFASLLAGLVVPRLATAGAPAATFEITRSPAEWKKLLSPEAYYVLREHGTERAGTSPLDKTYAAGMYHCAGCDLPLYASDTKFDSGTGWPSFWKAVDNAVGTSVDKSLFVTRTEVHCRRCGGHLGHIFPDGPKPTGDRHCINGVALKFVPKASS